MEWKKLMSSKRFRGSNEPSLKTDDRQEVRSAFMKDADRITFSPEFRKLQNKTQVHLFPKSDFVRTRLTHSLEVSTVGRSLGMAVGQKIVPIFKLNEGGNSLRPSDFASVVAAACLAHDIGNPPFGHSGEDAIRHWFITNKKSFKRRIRFEKLSDLEAFEGNAQGFRVLTRLAGWREQGGLRLTCATLGAFLKYPQESTTISTSGKEVRKKFSVFYEDIPSFTVIASELGLISIDGHTYSRHPLAFLVEASDDICYLIADLEDGIQLRLVNCEEVEKLLKDIVPPSERRGLDQIRDPEDRIEYLRAKAIGVLIDQAQQIFIDDIDSILKGSRSKDLLKDIPSVTAIKETIKLSKEKLYNSLNNIEREVAGFEVVGGLLTLFYRALLGVSDARNLGSIPSQKSKKITRLIPNLPSEINSEDPYPWLLRITDFISSLTDTAALSMYQKLKGVSLE
jgi:dGTPase